MLELLNVFVGDGGVKEEIECRGYCVIYEAGAGGPSPGSMPQTGASAGVETTPLLAPSGV